MLNTYGHYSIHLLLCLLMSNDALMLIIDLWLGGWIDRGGRVVVKGRVVDLWQGQVCCVSTSHQVRTRSSTVKDVCSK